MTTPSQPESKTPRTAAAVLRDEPDSQDKYVTADFACLLEIELNAAHAREDELAVMLRRAQNGITLSWIKYASKLTKLHAVAKEQRNKQ